MHSTFRALRHRNYRLWFAGQSISLIGTWMQTMAQQLLVYRLTGSAAALGLISFIGLIPLVPLSLWGGSLLDRAPKRAVLMITQAIMLAQALVLSALVLTGVVQTWHVFALAFLLGAVQAIDVPARQSFIVDMVENKEDMVNAVALNSAMFNMARAVGPSLAGVLVAATGEGIAFLLNALTFVAVLTSLAAMRNLPVPAPPVNGHQGRLRHMVEGLDFVRMRPTIRTLISLVAVSAFLSMPYTTLMPVFANQVLKVSAQPVVAALCGGALPIRCVSPDALPYGLLLGMVGVGAVCGALYIASLPYNARRGVMLTVGTVGFPLLLLLFSLSRNFAASLVVMFAAGFVFTWQNSLANTMLQMACPDALRGRVMSVYTMTIQMMMRLGSLQAGYMADWFSAPFALGIGALISLIYGLYVAVFHREIREL